MNLSYLELNNIVNKLYANLNSEIKIEIENELSFIKDYKLTAIIKLKLINKLTAELETETIIELDKSCDPQFWDDYIMETNYKHILNKETLYLINNKIDNLFDIDFKFIRQGYKLENYTDKQIVSYVQNNDFINHFFHPKQLYNLFNDKIKLLINNTNHIHINYDNKYYNVHNFIEHIDLFSFDTLKIISIREIENCNFTENKLLLLVYIGSEKYINNLLKKIQIYNNIENFSIAFCINIKLINIVVPIIKNCFNTNFIIYSSNEAGNDIVPSLLVYNEIISRYNFDYIIKIQTKTKQQFLNESIDYLFRTNLSNLILQKNIDSSCIGFQYIKNKDDIFNKKLILKFNNLIINTKFVPGTMFLTTKNVMDKVVLFLKYNYKTCFFQNMYDNNSLNKECSYIHFMERLFGYV
jgi:hypothetical protein